MELIFLIIIAVVDLVLGFLVISNNPSRRSNQLFALFLFFATLWAVGDALMLYGRSDVAVLTGANLFGSAPLFVMLGLLYFANYFPDDKPIFTHKILWFAALLPPIVFAYLIASNQSHFLTYDIALNAAWTGQNYITTHSAYLFYAYYFNVYFLLYIAVLLKKMLLNKHDKLVKRQVLFFVVTISATTLFAFIPNLILPNYFSITTLLWIGPLSAALFASLISYSIVKHRLFDIRLVVARTMAYVLSVAVLVTSYLIVVLGLGQLISIGSELNNLQRAFYVLVAFLFAVTLNPLKRTFDKLTNRVFYRDAYDTQEVLDVVSNVIVGNIDGSKIQKGALTAIAEALKSTYATFLILDSGERLMRGHLIGQHWEIHEPQELLAALRRAGRKIIIFDELTEPRVAKIKETLRIEDISLVSPLVTKDETIGYLIFGPKKSGNIYNSQDVGLLNIASNELAVALQNAQRFEEIQAFNITLQKKVTEATRELKVTNKKLIALDEAKDEFISMASHQLRTPLTSINGYLSMLNDGDMGKLNAKQEAMIKTAFGSSQRMSFLIADFLNVSRIKTGKFVIDAKKVDLAQIASDEISQLSEMADAHGVKLIYEKPGVFPAVKLDDNKIRQVMMNMVDNAIYYTPAGGTITVQLYSTGDEVIYKVVDTGIGVPKSEQHKLFTKFYRAGNARKVRPDGTGVGLFMAQKVVVEQGGAMIFESVEGKGSTFGFRFPLSKIKA